MFFAYSLTRRTRGVEIDMRTEFWMNFVSGNGSDFLTVDAKEVFFTYAALRAAVQAFTVLDNSESTPESVLPDRFRTWKE